MVILLTIISTIFNPAISTVIPTIVKKDELIHANSIRTTILNIGNLLAPILAGLVMSFYGLFLILCINSVSFILSAVSEMFIKIPKINKKPEKINLKSFKKDFSEGIQFIKKDKVILNITILAVVINFAYTPIFAMGIVYILKEVIGVTDYQYGICETFLVCSMIIGPLLAVKISKKFEVRKIIFSELFIVSILVAVVGFIPSNIYMGMFKSNMIPYVSLIFVVCIIGVLVTIGNISLSTMFQKRVPLEILGRVGSVRQAGCLAAAPLGTAIFGVLFDHLNVTVVVLISASILLVSILIYGFTEGILSSSKKKRDLQG